MEATPIILGSLGASPGSMERFMTFLLAYICILYIYMYTYVYIWEIKKMGNLYLSSNMAWEIRKIFPCPRLPKAQISWSLYGHNWGLPTSRHAHMMNNDVCVSRNCVDTSNWLFEFEWEKCGFEVLN